MTATDDAKKQVGAALVRAATELLASELDGPFSTISYPPGYNFFVQFGQPPYYNPATLRVVDQLCTKDADGIVTLTGSRFSGKYASILQNVIYKLSTSDVTNLATLQACFDDQTTKVISAFEANFGPITQQQIDDSKCWPASKIGYIGYIIDSKYAGDPQQIPSAYAGFTGVYMPWLSQGREIQAIASQKTMGQRLLAAALQHTVAPSSASAGWQIGVSSFGVAFTGLPGISAIVGSLESRDRKLTVTLELVSVDSKSLGVDQPNDTMIRMSKDLLGINLGLTRGIVNSTLAGLDGSATKVVMSIVYPGITVLQANPLEISIDLVTGWYSQSILSDICQKTGHDISGFQLYGSAFTVADLFGQGKAFARVKTFVVSQEPTIQLTFYGADANTIRNNFTVDSSIRLNLAGAFVYGATSNGLNVQKVETVNGNTVVTLAPPDITGTIPPEQQTAHVIGGVLDYPPTMSVAVRPGAITVKNSGAFVARFSIKYCEGAETKVVGSGNMPALVAKTLPLPALSTDILVTVEIATFFETWSVVRTYPFDRPVTKTFEMTGETWKPACKEV